MGSSDAVAFLEGACYLLLAVDGAAGCALEVTLDGRGRAARGTGGRSTPTVELRAGLDRSTRTGTYVLALQATSRASTRSRPSSRSASTCACGSPATASPVAEAETPLEVYDVAQIGSLYERIVERLVKPDTERQSPGLSHAYHPWFPVLLIGAHKAELYTRALVGDIVDKRRNLADPGWLVRVGLYLELLTALGVIEAVKDDVGDLLTRRGARGVRARRGVRRDPRAGSTSRAGAASGSCARSHLAAARAPGRCRP